MRCSSKEVHTTFAAFFLLLKAQVEIWKEISTAAYQALRIISMTNKSFKLSHIYVCIIRWLQSEYTVD